MKSLRAFVFAMFVAVSGWSGASAAAQVSGAGMSRNEMNRMHFMLLRAYDEVEKNYYDPKFHGVDLKGSYHRYDAALDKTTSLNQAFRVIQSFLSNLHDSHLFFVPPIRSQKMTPGYSMELIGDKCFVTRIRPGTDAALKLHLGDQVMTLDGFRITPKNFNDLMDLVRVLSGSPEDVLDLVGPTNEQRHVTVSATRRSAQSVGDISISGVEHDHFILEDEEDEHRDRSRVAEFGDTIVWKLPSFAVDPPAMDRAVAKAARSKNVILDLRGNGGGYVDTLRELVSHCFDHEVKIADRVTRKNSKAETVKPKAPLITGKITVLVDHNSASASELFARLMQLEKRATILGDHSAGEVMEAGYYTESYGTETMIFFGFSVTDADLVMADGKSLENVGVTPDKVMLPTASELAEEKDPVLSYALSQYGVTLDPAAAGKLFPFEWPRL